MPDETGLGVVLGGDVSFDLVKRGPGFIRKHDHVVLVSSDDLWCLAQAGTCYTAKIGKKGKKTQLGGLVGAPWGSVFTSHVRRGLARCPEDDRGGSVVNWDHDVDIGKQEKNNGEHGVDVLDEDPSTRQKLSQQDIEKLKADGAAPEQITRLLAEGNVSFDAKNKLAQQKYLQRKENKYRFRVRATRPTARSVCHFYSNKAPEKSMYLRYDSLGLMINVANVRPSSQILMIDQTGGLVLAAAAERLGGRGRILCFFNGNCPASVEGPRYFNFEDPVMRTIVHVPARFLDRVHLKEEGDDEPLTYFNTTTTEPDNEDAAAADQLSQEEIAGRKKRKLDLLSRRPLIGQLKQWLRDGSDSLLIASRDGALDHLKALLPLLAASGSFAIFSPFLQPLAEIQYAVSQTSMTTRAQLSEMSMQHHQVKILHLTTALRDVCIGVRWMDVH